MSNNSLAEYYFNKKRLQKKARERRKRKNNINMVTNDVKIYQKMKQKLVEYKKNIAK